MPDFVARLEPAGRPPSRRDWLRLGVPAVFAPFAHASPPTSGGPGFGRAKSVVVIFTSGGQSQLDTWDPKPDAPEEIRGVFRSIQSRTPTLRVCEHLPKLAALSDKYAVLRTMTHDDLDHGSACYLALTGQFHQRKTSNPSPRGTDAPALGAILHRVRPDRRFPHSAFHVNGLEYHGQLSCMKAGLYFADRLSTVSPTYAREIQTPEQGHGLDGLLRTRSGVLSGILNAVDDQVWNPARDARVPHAYDVRRPGGKTLCKAALQQQLGLALAPAAPLFVLVSRLTEQKGLHLVLSGLDALLAQGGQLALLGSGDGWLEEAFRQRAAARPEAVSATIGYDEDFAHRLFGAGDVTLVTSLFEPCGLTQMYGLKYGSLPLVHRVGGLADTVVDCTLEDMAAGTATGFCFDDFSEAGYARALRRAFALYARPPDWRRVRAAAMRRPADWGAAAAQYIDIYTHALLP